MLHSHSADQEIPFVLLAYAKGFTTLYFTYRWFELVDWINVA